MKEWKISQLLALVVISVVGTTTPVTAAQIANAGLLLRDLQDFGPEAAYSQGSDGHVILECWREPWKEGEAIIAQWRLRTYHSSLLYVNGAVRFSVSATRLPLNSSPVGFSVPWTNVTSGSEELYLDAPLSSDFQPSDVFATIGGYVEVGVESGGIIPTTADCPQRRL